MINDHKSVTVITPCFNCDAYISDTINSVINQTYKPIEHIIVDDGSTDNSSRIIESFGNRVRLLSQQNRGVSHARNRGLLEAKGEYILFLDGDDILHEKALENLINVIKNPNSIALMGANYFYKDISNVVNTTKPNTNKFFPEILKNNLAPIHCWLTPKYMIQNAGGVYEKDQLLWEDWDLWCQIALSECDLCTTPFIGAYYRIHEKSLTRTTKTKDHKRGYINLIKRVAEGFIKNPNLIKNYGEDVFWGAWTAIKTSRSVDISWEELNAIIIATDKLLGHIDFQLSNGRTLTISKLFGLKKTYQLYELFNKTRSYSKK